MDQTVSLRVSELAASTRRLADHVAASVERARVDSSPFHHLELRDIFPESTYAAMLHAMPHATDYRPMHGRGKVRLADGAHARVKIDLFPEYIRHLPRDKLAVWRVVGDALRSETLKDAFRRKLAPALERRFGKEFATVGMYPIPILTRDTPGYFIEPHTDTHWKGITVQLYLPKDDSNPDIGTFLHEELPDGSTPKRMQMKFARNSGYAFAVHDDTWHSADRVHDRIKTRDSILLTYFVDQGAARKLRNRAKRAGNLVRNEIRNLV